MHDNLVWIVDDDHAIRWVLDKALSQAEICSESFATGNDLLEALKHRKPATIISDIRMPGIDGLDLLSEIHTRHPDLPVIIMTAHSDLDSAVASYQGGAFEYLPKPFDINTATSIVKRALAHNQQQATTKQQPQPPSRGEIIGEAPAMQEVFRAIGRLSHSDINVLINGASGTGKELVAAALHQHSPRGSQPFIALNMAAIPKDLIESELFGHEKGAFTGATNQRKGRFEQAHGGTLFLDEIGDMPAETQTRLLRVLADGEFYRVGGHTPVKVDVRIIAATHQNLEQRVKQHRFREDLFHRLNVIRLHLPALKDRREDIPALSNHFLSKAALELQMEPKILAPETEQLLCSLEWPGNIRQLENTCHWLTVMAASRELQPADLPAELKDQPSSIEPENDWQQSLAQWAQLQLLNEEQQTGLLSQALLSFEKVMINAALQHTQGRKGEAAKLLGWGRNTLTRKIKELIDN
ncbi:MAG: nitrogen regulation protein NR(I) [Pseudomonadales bacterium]